jgi:TolB protein
MTGRLAYGIIAASAALLLATAAPAPSWAKSPRKAEAAAEHKVLLALPDFAVEGDLPSGIGREIASIVANDISLLTGFELLALDALPQGDAGSLFPEGGKAVDLARWSEARAEAVLAGKVRLRGDVVTLELKLWDTARNTALFSRKYDAPRGSHRDAAHRLANDVPFAFTGVRGIFDTVIAFTAHPATPEGPGRGKEVFLVGLDGADLRQLTGNGSFNLFPRWAPGGRHIAFTSFRTGLPAIYLRDLAARTEEPLVTSGTSMSPGGFSPSGDILYFSRSEAGATDVMALPVGAESPARVATGAISTSPTVSPDGTLMAFVSDRGGSPAIYVKELGKTSSERAITPPGKFSTSPCWSPAGDLIAFTAQSAGKFSLMLVKPDGTELRPLLTGGGDYIDPTFSPDGRFIAYTYQEKGRSELRIVSIDGRITRRVFRELTGIGSPSWSPRR